MCQRRSAKTSTRGHSAPRCSPLLAHTYDMEVTDETTHLDRSALKEEAESNIPLRTRQHTNEKAGVGLCQRRPCADQHGHSARRTAWTSPSRRPTEKYHRRSRSRPRPCRPRPGGRLCSRTTQRTRSRTTGPRGGGGPAVRGTCVRWHSRCGPGARRKRLAVRFSPTWRCGDCAFSTNANVRIVLTSHCRFLNVTESKRFSSKTSLGATTNLSSRARSRCGFTPGRRNLPALLRFYGVCLIRAACPASSPHHFRPEQRYRAPPQCLRSCWLACWRMQSGHTSSGSSSTWASCVARSSSGAWQQ